MKNKIIYCLDCEKDYQDALKNCGYEILSGCLGYRRDCNKYIMLDEAPNECDVLIFNLTNPACFDMNSWGPYGGNDNFKCKVVEKVDKSMYISHGRYEDHKKHPRYSLIKESQMNKDNSTFNYSDLQKAICDGGIDCIYYLNPSFMFHSLYDIPDWMGFTFKTDTTKSRRWNVSEEAINIYESLKDIGKHDLDLELWDPIEFKLLDLVTAHKIKEDKLTKIDLLTNNVNECLAAIVKVGKGFIYFIPPFINPVNPVMSTVKLIDDILPNFSKSYSEWEQKHKKESKAVAKEAHKLIVASELLPITMFNNTRNYIIKVVGQINGCYSNGFYDACAAMMRRLIETLIIEIYETTGRLDEIKFQGEIISLEKIIGKISSGGKIHISRNVKKTLDNIKLLGDTGSHNRKVNLAKHNIDDVKSELKIAIEELMQYIRFKKT